MEDLIYREIFLERLAAKVKFGSLQNPEIQARLVNPLCGDEVKIEMKIVGGKIVEAVYSGNGCVISQVSASYIAEKIEGMGLSEVKQLKAGDILKILDINLSPSRLKCALLSFEVLKSAVK